jgi:hypothetical protein
LEHSQPPQKRGLPEDLPAAIEDTLASIGEAGAAASAEVRSVSLGRARELLDPLVALGESSRTEIASQAEGARGQLTRRGAQAREVSAAMAVRVLDAVSDTLAKSKRKVEGE